MRKLIVACLTLATCGYILAGCSVGEVTADQQQAKAKAMDDIAKTDPNYAMKQAHGRAREGR